MTGFINAWLLGALAAILLPIAIHFLTNPRPKKIYFPTFQFLFESTRGKQRLYKIRTFIVLLTRCLAIVFLVLLFAKPFTQNKSREKQSGSSNNVVVIIDSTMSMAANLNNLTLFDKARAEATKLINNFSAGTHIGLVFIKNRPEALLPVLSNNIKALIQGLEKARPGMSTGSPGDAIELAGQMLGNPGTIHIFSDFQYTNFKKNNFINKSPHGIILHPMTNTAIDNIAVTDIQLTPSNPVAGEPIEITCQILNASLQHRHEPVYLNFMGKQYTKTADLKPFTTTHITFDTIAETSGMFQGLVSLKTKDSLQIDNQRFFKMTVKQSTMVLIICDQDEKDLTSGAFYLKTAIVPYETKTGIKAVIRHSQNTDSDILNQTDIFILCPPVTLTEKLANAISSRVTEGLQLICFTDGDKAPKMLNTLKKASKGILAPPFKLLTRKQADDSRGDTLTRIDYSRPPLRLFAKPGQGDLSRLRFSRHYKTTPVDKNISSRPFLMHYPDGSAAMVITPAAKGKVIFMNYSITPHFGNLVSSPLFPALIHECLRFSPSHDSAKSNYPDNSLDILVPYSSNNTMTLQVRNPKKKILEYNQVALGKYIKLTIAETNIPGFYPVYLGKNKKGFGVINVNPIESDTRLYPLDKIEKTSMPGLNKAVIAKAHSTLLKSTQKKLWPIASLVLAGLLAIEMLTLAVWRKRNG